MYDFDILFLCLQRNLVLCVMCMYARKRREVVIKPQLRLLELKSYRLVVYERWYCNRYKKLTKNRPMHFSLAQDNVMMPPVAVNMVLAVHRSLCRNFLSCIFLPLIPCLAVSVVPASDRRHVWTFWTFNVINNLTDTNCYIWLNIIWCDLFLTKNSWILKESELKC